MFNSTNIPEELKALSQWVLWKKETRDGRITKVPYYLNGYGFKKMASSTNPKTWTTFENALAIYELHPEEFDGLGFVFTKESGLVFMDVDHCFEAVGFQDGQKIPSAILTQIYDIIFRYKFSTYSELSQSGEGLHFIFKGTIPRDFKNPHNGVEMYTSGRYCAMTGNVDGYTSIEGDKDVLAELFEAFKTPERVKPTEMRTSPEGVDLLSLPDVEIIEKASGAPSSGELFQALFSGETSMYNSTSEAELRFCQLLAFWCDRNPETIDRIYRMSGLYREKWEREDYRNATIEKACSYCEETISEYKIRKKREDAINYEKLLLARK